MNKLKTAVGTLLVIAVLYLAYSYIQIQRQIAENGRFQKSGSEMIDTRTGENYRLNRSTGETKKINEPIAPAQ